MLRLESAVNIAYLACYGRHVGNDMAVQEATFLLREAYPGQIQRVHQMLSQEGNERRPEEPAKDYYQRMAGKFLHTKRRAFQFKTIE